MNTPNKLTILRIALVPFFVLFLLLDSIPNNMLWAAIIFAAASITDAIDGKIARKYNLVTNFGKFVDPLADKILVTSALICFVELNFINSVMVVIILSREFIVTSLRLVASGKGTVIAASVWGKSKTLSQMIGISAILAVQALMQITGADGSLLMSVCVTVMWCATALTLISGIEYMFSNREYFNDK